MALVHRIVSGFRRLFNRDRAERELDEEMRDYLEMAADDKASAGLSREAALRAARVELGSVDAVKESARDIGWESLVETLCQDVRYGIRTLRR